MCGLVGWAGSDPAEEAVARGLAAIEHRGPDASATRRSSASDGSCACVLGSVRLRILDVSPNADQPMSTDDGTVSVSFNGELYNHRELREWLTGLGYTFRTGTDTEDLLYAYLELADDPSQLPSRLRGMFAFAIWDASRARLLLARDRLGIKPLYVTDPPGGGIAFGSEVRALARAGAVAASHDPDAVRGYLLRGVVPAPRSIMQGVRALPPGSVATWTPDRPLDVHRWWTPRLEADAVVAADPVKSMRDVLQDSVSRHLIADRPVGIFLSSGVDSGAIATVAARQGAVRTFTVTFPDIADGEGDEGDDAAALAGRIGAQHSVVPVVGRDIAGWVRQAIEDMDQPTHDGVNSWLVSRAAHEAGLVVALSGLGGDELFGGYHTFGMVPRVAAVRSAVGIIPGAARRSIAKRLAARTPGDRLGRVLVASPGLGGSYYAVRGLFSSAELPDPPPGLSQIADEVRANVNGVAPADAVTLLEATTYMADQLLRDTDQMSMAHSLEVRVPLLDDDVVATALATPADVRTREGKWLLVAASGLPLVHRKRPFALPFDRWIQGPLRDMVREGLLSDALPFADVLPRDFRRRLWDAVEAGRGHWSRPWAVTVLRLWPGAQGFDWR